jgi:hypothetical protein
MRMILVGRLRDYPFVVVRFACRECPRLGRYRLAVGTASVRTLTWEPCWKLFRRAVLASWKATPDADAVRIILTCPRLSRRTCQPISGLNVCG